MSVTIDLLGADSIGDPGLWLAMRRAIARQTKSAAKLSLGASSSFPFTDATSGVFEAVCDRARKMDAAAFPHLLAVVTPGLAFEPFGMFAPVDFTNPVTVELQPPPGVPRVNEDLSTIVVGSAPRLLAELSMLAAQHPLTAGILDEAERALKAQPPGDDKIELCEIEDIMDLADADDEGPPVAHRLRWGLFVLTFFARHAIDERLVVSFS